MTDMTTIHPGPGEIWEPTLNFREATCEGGVDCIIQQAWRERNSGAIEWRRLPVVMLGEAEFRAACRLKG